MEQEKDLDNICPGCGAELVQEGRYSVCPNRCPAICTTCEQ